MSKINIISNIIIGLILIASVVGFFLITTNLDPDYATNVAYLYLDVFAVIFSFTFFVGYWSRRIFGTRELAFRHFSLSIRQSAWFGILVVAALALLSYGFFNWWSAVLLAGSLIFLESYFIFK